MPLFNPVTVEGELPPLNEAYEHTTLDAKLSARLGPAAPSPFVKKDELAKDVSGFANALGGTILVGADEDPARGLITSYVPLTEADATETIDTYNAATTLLCSPLPLIQPARIPHRGGVIVAINIWPFIGQLVGVSDAGRGRQGRMFRFPYRVGNACVWIEPEQHAMFMIPTIRRMVILLESIPAAERATVQVMPAVRGGGSGPGAVTFDGVDVYKNVAIFTRTNPPAAQGREPTRQHIHIALDDIDRIWRAGNGFWRIRLSENAQW